MTGRVGDSKYYNINDNDAGTVDKKRRNNPEGQARLRRGNEMERTKEVFLVDIAVCVGYSKNTTASKKPPGSALGILATLQCQLLSRVASANSGKRRAAAPQQQAPWLRQTQAIQMPSLVSEFIINPVLRQARRFSEISRATLAGDEETPVVPPDAVHDSDDADDVGQQGSDASPERRRSRPLSSSTQETIVEEVPAGPAAGHGPVLDHLGFPITLPRNAPTKSGPIPEDDGMRELRTRIQEINAREIPSNEKARLMHDTLLEGYRASVIAGSPLAKSDSDDGSIGQTWELASPVGPLESLKYWQNQLIGEPSVKETFVLSESDIAPTYAPVRHSRTPSVTTPTHSAASLTETRGPLGCEHYERNVKLQCSTCKKWYTCRFCHDIHEDHTLIRKDTKNMLCMLCATPQKASEVCSNCGVVSAQYYCNISILSQPMPPDFRDTKAKILCNDCSARSTVAYHWLGLKCSICRSYNTVELQIMGQNADSLQPAAGDQPQVAREAGSEEAVPGARRISITTGSRVPNRRRHSSNAPEPPSRILERYARSMSPSHMMMDIPQAALVEVDGESDDDILGFWRGGEDDEDDESSGDEYDSDESSEDDAPEADDDEDDDEDEFNLIGHR
ncbi:hypothetical protein TrVFT333_009748 [Trichoderma virens FT-333]|nr:hypothetical protein TrVFT333_009748 [Trichoderma virens FT-333]